MDTLSVFVDESGDFGSFDPKSPFYIFSLVFHNQNDDSNELFDWFRQEMINLKFKKPYFHAGPILRKENEYKYFDLKTRKSAFNKMTVFIHKLPIKYTTIVVNKKEIKSEVDLILHIQKSLKLFIDSNLDYFTSFNKIVLYYDNGQKQLSKILRLIFDISFKNIEERFDADPFKYNLFQVADALSTFQLVSLKYDLKLSSRTELEFFGSNKKYFKNNYLDKLRNKRLN